MGVYDRQIASALRLISKYGQLCPCSRETVQPDNPDKPWLGGTAVPAVYQRSIAFIPATDGASGFGMTKFRDRDAQTASFSTFGLMGHDGYTPKVEDTILRADTPLVMVAVDTLDVNGEPILHILSIV